MASKKKDDGLDRREFLKTASVGAVGLGLTGVTARSLLADEGKEEATDRIKTRSLGKTGMTVSVVGYGCGGLQPQHLPMLQKAHESGVTLYDTAWGYQRGQSEVAIGKFVATLKDRESIQIVTKATGWSPPQGSAKDVYAALKKRLEESLKKMQTEYVDLFYWPHGAQDPKATRHEACREALLKLKQEKVVRHIGTSSHKNYAKVCEAAIEDGYYEVLMPVINICTMSPEKAGEVQPGRRRRGRSVEDTSKLLEQAKKKGVGIIGMKVANGGFLGANTEALLTEAFPGETKLSMHQKLYSWMLKQDGMSSVIVGIRSLKHLTEAIEVGRLASGDKI